MKTRMAALICGLCAAAWVRAGPLTMVSAGDPVLDDIRYVAQAAGVRILSFTPPLSRDEIETILDAVDPAALPPPARQALARIQDRLNPRARFREGLFSLSFQPAVEVAAGIRSNTALSFRQGGDQHPALLSLPLDFYFADVVQLNLEPSLQLDPAFNEADGHFVTNVPYQSERIDVFSPFRAFLAAGGAWWSFQIGRDRLSFGTARTGNLLVSDAPDFYDFARLSFFSKRFKYSALVMQNPLILSMPFYDPDELDGRLDQAAQRHIYIHRLDFKIVDTVALGLTEGLSVGNAPLEIRYLNPLMVMHNFISGGDYESWGGSYYETNSSIFSVDLNWTAAPSLSFHAQLVIDEFTTPWEVASDADNRTPAGMGYLAGVEASRAFGGWGAQFYAEAAYTDPYVYVDNSPFASFVWMRRMNRKSMEFRYRWIGHPEGRDMILFAAGSRFARDALTLSAAFTFSLHGEHSIYWDWGRGDRYADETTPTGRAQKKITATFGAAWQPVRALTLCAEAGGAAAFNAGNTASNEYGAECQVSVKYEF